MQLRRVSVSLALLPLLGAAHSLSAQRTPVAVVAQLYRDFAWEALIDEPRWPGHSLVEQPRNVLARYFDDTLTNLLLADRACAARVDGECNNLDFDPIWASQDPSAANMTITPTADSAIVAVKYVYSPNRVYIELSFRMSRTRFGWRVHDIVYADGTSLVSILRKR
jgi:hypothetical protein